MGNHSKTSTDPETASGFQIHVQPVLDGEDSGASVKYQTASGIDTTAGGEAGDLPKTYGESTIYLVAQDPHRLFTYWDLDITRHPGGPAVIRCLRGSLPDLEVEFEVPFEARNWYIPVSAAGATYKVEIGFYRSGEWNLLAASEPVATPRDTVSGDDSFEFATLPLDTAFSALLASLPPQVRHHPELMRHLASIQKKQADSAPGVSPASRNEEALRLLQGILGDALMLELLSGSRDSASLSSEIHARLVEALSSEESSALLARFREVASESSLFSGIVQFVSFSGGMSSDTLSSAGMSSEILSSWTGSLLSWAHAARHAAASEWLSSFQLAPGGVSSESLSSGSAAGGAPASASSWFSLFASSWDRGAESSWAESGLSSVQSSWTGETLSSWSPAALSSWFGQSLSSWSAESLSSWTKELLTSWSSAESGSWPTASPERNFFMHVNAELIFYGGTHPKAALSIDGKNITLQPDGTFHYHFIFPDGEYEIPIVAVSPDGLETRKAVLRFERETLREGRVDATGQPSIHPPMGRK